ncbi:MAG TPA: hypothetical protein VHT27_00655 [Solirubrobacteraceae bacterium]|nr:hypothetical protein [Solirubrobacteraceae bacterium]
MQSPSPTLVLGIAENGLTFVVIGTVAFSLVMSILFLVTRGHDSMYDHIGQGGLSRESDFASVAPAPPPDSPAAAAEREQEVRQMVRARSDRLVRRGEPPLDVDSEVARLLGEQPSEAAAVDEGLVEEVRQLVVARNERRARQGLEPLDVDAEVERTLEELDP